MVVLKGLGSKRAGGGAVLQGAGGSEPQEGAGGATVLCAETADCMTWRRGEYPRRDAGHAADQGRCHGQTGRGADDPLKIEGNCGISSRK